MIAAPTHVLSLVSEAVTADLAPVHQSDVHGPIDCVVIGDAAHYFTYEALNSAFQCLMAMPQPRLVSMGRSKYYQQLSQDNGPPKLMLDVGPYMRALEYALNIEAEVIGK